MKNWITKHVVLNFEKEIDFTYKLFLTTPQRNRQQCVCNSREEEEKIWTIIQLTWSKLCSYYSVDISWQNVIFEGGKGKSSRFLVNSKEALSMTSKN